MLTLVPLCTLELELGTPITRIAAGPLGRRNVLPVRSVRVTGERLQGQLCDYWTDCSLTVNGVATLNVRAVIETGDGARIFLSYTGRADVSRTTPDRPFADAYYAVPQFETDDPRYAWLNSIQAAGKGTIAGGVMSYEWYELR